MIIRLVYQLALFILLNRMIKDELVGDLPKITSYAMTISNFLFGKAVDHSPKDFVIAGPCAIESEDVLVEIARTLSRMGIKVLRGGSFKHRTKPYSFSGLGRAGLQIHSRVARSFEMLSVSEILDTADIDSFATYIDIFQIGARNMRNYPLLKAAAAIGKPVILKRDMSATLYEWLASAEHLLYHGCKQIALCERGVRWHDTAFRNLPDFTSMLWIKKYLDVPLIFDPSHACGRSDLIRELSYASGACGVDALMIETHTFPTKALCDAAQAITPAQLGEILSDWTMLFSHCRPVQENTHGDEKIR